MDIENPQMLQYIICRTKQTCANDLYQQFNLWKGLIKYNKLNGIIPMKTHIEFTYPNDYLEKVGHY
jgi:hypothetical protein